MRVVVLTITLLFVTAFGALTAIDISRNGVTALAVVAILVLLVFVVGIVGALRQPPRQ